jgi:hypothetical protein
MVAVVGATLFDLRLASRAEGDWAIGDLGAVREFALLGPDRGDDLGLDGALTVEGDFDPPLLIVGDEFGRRDEASTTICIMISEGALGATGESVSSSVAVDGAEEPATDGAEVPSTTDGAEVVSTIVGAVEPTTVGAEVATSSDGAVVTTFSSIVGAFVGKITDGVVADGDGLFGFTKGSFVGFGRKDGRAVGVLGDLGPFLGVVSIGLLDLGLDDTADDGSAL